MLFPLAEDCDIIREIKNSTNEISAVSNLLLKSMYIYVYIIIVIYSKIVLYKIFKIANDECNIEKY